MNIPITIDPALARKEAVRRWYEVARLERMQQMRSMLEYLESLLPKEGGQ